jgi:hypothetical protein
MFGRPYRRPRVGNSHPYQQDQRHETIGKGARQSAIEPAMRWGTGLAARTIAVAVTAGERDTNYRIARPVLAEAGMDPRSDRRQQAEDNRPRRQPPTKNRLSHDRENVGYSPPRSIAPAAAQRRSREQAALRRRLVSCSYNQVASS